MSVCGKFRKRSERQSLAGSVGQTIPFLPKLALWFISWSRPGLCLDNSWSITNGIFNFLLDSCSEILESELVAPDSLPRWPSWCWSLQRSLAGAILDIWGCFGSFSPCFSACRSGDLVRRGCFLLLGGKGVTSLPSRAGGQPVYRFDFWGPLYPFFLTSNFSLWMSFYASREPQGKGFHRSKRYMC